MLHAADGLTALELHAAHQPDLVILDWMLPKLDGLEVLRRLCQASATPILVLTARELNQSLRIIVRAVDAANADKLRKAGSTRVVCAQTIGAKRIVDVLLRPAMVDFVERAHADVELEMAVKDILKVAFRPEFLNRIDETLTFHRLEREQMKQIAGIQLDLLTQRLAQKKIDLEITDEALDRLAKEGYDPAFGARPLKRLIQQYIENPLAKRLLASDFTEGDAVTVDTGGVMFEFEKREPAAQPA